MTSIVFILVALIGNSTVTIDNIATDEACSSLAASLKADLKAKEVKCYRVQKK